MEMVNVDGSSLQTNSQTTTIGSASAFINWTTWTLAVALSW